MLGEAAADELLKTLAEYQALLIGPGIGREQTTLRFLERLLGLDAPRRKARIGFRIAASAEDANAVNRPELPPVVFDADALNLLSGNVKTAEESVQRGDFFQRTSASAASVDEDDSPWWDHLPHGRAILTPHAGEMARLLGVNEITGNPVTIASDAAIQWGQIVVLKGPQTVVAHPDGRVMVHDGPNAALATAGTGDVLAGAITGLLAQGLRPFDAAVLGVYLHSAAGHMLQSDLGSAGGLASDLLPRLPLAIRELRGA
jgi:NAD(P)H-hydrate epimerase